MVQFLSTNFFSWISSIFVGFLKISPFFCVSLYIYIYIYIKHYVRACEKVLGEKFKCACAQARVHVRAHTHILPIFITFKDVSWQLNRQIPAILPILDYIMLNEMERNCKGRLKCMLSNTTQSGQTVSTST